MINYINGGNMKNFAISAKDEIADRGQETLEKLRINDKETKADLFERMLDLVEAKIENNELKKNGVDTEALDASLSNIRALFISATGGREELKASYDMKLQEIQEQKKITEQKFSDELKNSNESIKTLQEQLSGSQILKDTAIKNATAMEEKANMAYDLVNEFKKTNNKLQQELNGALKDLEALEQTKADLTSANNRIHELESSLKEKEESSAAALLAKEKEFQMKLELEKEKSRFDKEKAVNDAVQEKEAEMLTQIRQMEIQLAILKEKNNTENI